jgi:hypothetical protein
VPRKHHRSRTQTEGSRARSQPRQNIQHRGNLTPACKVVFYEEGTVVSELFRFYIEIDVVEEALPNACTQRRTVSLRTAKQSKKHIYLLTRLELQCRWRKYPAMARRSEDSRLAISLAKIAQLVATGLDCRGGRQESFSAE